MCVSVCVCVCVRAHVTPALTWSLRKSLRVFRLVVDPPAASCQRLIRSGASPRTLKHSLASFTWKKDTLTLNTCPSCVFLLFTDKLSLKNYLVKYFGEKCPIIILVKRVCGVFYCSGSDLSSNLANQNALKCKKNNWCWTPTCFSSRLESL